MDLDRGALAKIDRRVLSGLGHEERYQMVRVPVSEAMWSTWRRYCGALGVPMGRAMATLIQHELRAVVDNPDGDPVFIAQIESREAERQAALDGRERQLDAREQRLQAQQHQRLVVPVGPRPASRAVKVGRNDRCPCESGLKYKRCHGA
ncbi:MAG: SEC-C metal-binding domain-containing protein [Acidimicrobiia bacterium]